MLKKISRWSLRLMLLAALVYLSIYACIGWHAYQSLANPPTQKADAVMVLGNRAYWNGKPNPCLTGRVDTGVALAQQGLASRILMSGGQDDEDGRTEAGEMQKFAQAAGYQNEILQEKKSTSTFENLSFSAPILAEHDIKSVIVVSEPYHLWRAERLAKASGFDGQFTVQYAAAPSFCWQQWGMLFKGALREPLAVVDNGLKGYLW